MFTLIRPDAGVHSGLGHVSRCLALAQALGRRGHDVSFCIARDEVSERKIDHAGFGVMTDAGPEVVEYLLKAARDRTAHVVVVDSYTLGAAHLSALRDHGLLVVFIDDFAREPLPAQIVVNGSAGADRLSYVSSRGDTTFLLGPTYALLRSEFGDAPVRRINPEVKRVLVTVGGADPMDVSSRLLQLLGRVEDAEYEIDVVVGPMFDRRLEALSAIGCEKPVRLVRGAESLRDLMIKADLALTAGGQTLYELAVTGTPAIALILYDNQAASVRALSDEGTLVFGGEALDGMLPEGLTHLFVDLLRDRQAREQLSAAGQRVVDGRGADRVAAAIEAAA